MIEPIHNTDEIDEELIAKMSRESISKEYLLRLYTTEMDELVLLVITQEQVILIRASLGELYHPEIAEKVLQIIGDSKKNLLVNAWSVGKNKGFIGNFNHCSMESYCKRMYEVYDLFVKYIKSIKTKEWDYLIDEGLVCNVETPINNEKDSIICGIPLEEVKRILGEEIQKENGDDDYCL